MKRQNYTDSELVHLSELFVNGDTEAFSALYDHYVENIYRYIFFKVNSADSEDLTEIVFIKVWENRKKFDPAKSSFSSWIYTIARNTVIDHYRVVKPVEELHDNLHEDAGTNHPKYIVEENLVSTKIREAINQLAPNYRDLVLLRFIDDLSYSEIAKVLDKKEGAVRIMQFRAMRELKKILQKMGFDE